MLLRLYSILRNVNACTQGMEIVNTGVNYEIMGELF